MLCQNKDLLPNRILRRSANNRSVYRKMGIRNLEAVRWVEVQVGKKIPKNWELKKEGLGKPILSKSQQFPGLGNPDWTLIFFPRETDFSLFLAKKLN